MMKELKEEIRHRFQAFEGSWQKELSDVAAALGKSQDVYFESYLQLVSLNMWRTELLSHLVSPDALSFFLEAQNDILVSHVLARMGAWRSALKSLRSSLENVLYAVYFKDHPVELARWKVGTFKPGFSAALEYLKKHPHVTGIALDLSGIDMIEKEYATLSKAVHGSIAFQMTAGKDGTSLWTNSLESLGKWRTREKVVIQSINLLLLTLFREHLQGSQRQQLRNSVSFAISENKHSEIKSQLGVALTPLP